jgi:hypothetical protein
MEIGMRIFPSQHFQLEAEKVIANYSFMSSRYEDRFRE